MVVVEFAAVHANCPSLASANLLSSATKQDIINHLDQTRRERDTHSSVEPLDSGLIMVVSFFFLYSA
jgi:hypothetical protein